VTLLSVPPTGIAARSEDAELVVAFRENRHAMYRIARRICGDDGAPDVVQEVFLRVWRSRAFDESRGTMRSYLLTITRGVALDMVRHRAAAQRRDRSSSRGATVASDETGLLVLRNEEKGLVGAALDLLSGNEREVIVAAFFGGLTYREIADELSLPEGTVKSRIRVAMTKLRYHLREVATSSDAGPRQVAS
jgi:RNA polymerase sigma-70 factor (ECF subfamily)